LWTDIPSKDEYSPASTPQKKCAESLGRQPRFLSIENLHKSLLIPNAVFVTAALPEKYPIDND
jgi:hypothetical protein